MEHITNKIDIESIYQNMILSNYTFDEIKLYFLITYGINIETEYDLKKKRTGQKEFRDQLLNRYNKCIITGSTNLLLIEACHIIPFTDSNNMDIDNGLLLYTSYHKMFDNYLWSINPITLCVEINLSNNCISDDYTLNELNKINNMNLSNVLDQYDSTIKYLAKHYDEYKKNCINLNLI